MKQRPKQPICDLVGGGGGVGWGEGETMTREPVDLSKGKWVENPE